jgi:anti-sigma28 factor (negative regulator of flagellin synthesis)
MHIKNNALGLTQAPGQPAKPVGTQNSNYDVSSIGSDTVRLSNVTQLSSGDSPKVRQLAGDYEVGRYRVSPERIASSIIESLLRA